MGIRVVEYNLRYSYFEKKLRQLLKLSLYLLYLITQTRYSNYQVIQIIGILISNLPIVHYFLLIYLKLFLHVLCKSTINK